MKRKTIGILLITLLTTTMLALASAFAWLCGTTSGARWLLTSVSRYTPLNIAVQAVEGRLADHLVLSGVRAETGLQAVEIDRLELRWLPLLLLAGQIGVRELTLDGVRIRDNSPPSKLPPDLTWPRLPETALMFDVRIARLRVNRFSYRQVTGQPVIITSLAASAEWKNTILSLKGLDTASPDGRITGTVATGLRRPSLTADLLMSLPSPLAGMDRISINANLLPGRGSEQMAGTLSLSGATGKRPRMGLTGEVGVIRHGFNLRRVRLIRPGMRGRVTGEGSLILTLGQPYTKMRVTVAGLDMAPDVGMATDVTGELSFEGEPADYRGSFSLANRGKEWRTLRLSGGYRGTDRGMRLSSLQSALLGGSAAGDLDISWANGFTLRGALRARAINPARIAPEWKGVINADLDGSAAFPAKGSPRWNLSAKLLKSTLHGQPLTGELQAAFSNNALRIDNATLHGKGFDITGHGTPDNQLMLTALIRDLSRLLPGAAGEFRADARVRWRNGRLSGDLNGSGRALAARGIRMSGANLTARLGEGTGYPLHVTAALRSVRTNHMQADSITLDADGTLAGHTLNAAMRSSGAEARAGLSGSYDKGKWRGRIMSLSGRDAIGPWKLDAPADLAVGGGRIVVSPLSISGAGTEHISIAADVTENPLGGRVQAQWSGLNMARINQWLQATRVSGTGNGSLRMNLAPHDRLTVAANIGLQGTLTLDGKTFTIRRGLLSLDANERGQRAGVDVQLADSGQLKGTFSSSAPARPALPDTGALTAEWSGLDLALLRPWLPKGATVEGRLSGRTAGRLLAGKRLELEGAAAFSPTSVQLLSNGGKYNGKIRNAAVSWSWQGQTLNGSMNLDLEGRGQVRGSFRLPLPAQLPVAPSPRGPVRATLNGAFQEQGLLTALFPEMIRESHGDVTATLNISGSWQAPLMAGELHLTRAGAYLPAAGIHVREVRLDAHLDRDSIRIDSFRTDSGPGHMEGTALIRLKGWHVDGYTGNVNGDRFQVFHLPELRLMATPRLTFEGTPGKLTVTGEVRLPEMLVQGPPLGTVIKPSKDVIVEGAPPPSAAPASPLALDVRIRVIPGDKVFVKMEGIDAQLGGSIDLIMRGSNKITSRGEIKVVKGHYKAYGIDLEIVRGRVYYAGGSIERPTLDILALRTVGEVKAGVTVTGPIQNPLVKLYSEPSMPDADTLAYVVLGHPLSSGSSQVSLLTQAAGLLLSSNQAFSLKDEIQNRLGLSTLELQTESATTTRMGYKPIVVTPPGSSPAQTATTLSQTLVTVGKYLTPELYLSYGRSVISNSNLVRLRYSISKSWELETESGTASGADIYYKIEFK